MNTDTLVVGEFQVNCFILWVKEPDAIVIDPGSEPDAIRARLTELRLVPRAYLLTHGHVDHVSGLAGLYDWAPATVGMHPADLRWAFEPVNQMFPFYDAPRRPKAVDRLLRDGDTFDDAGLRFRVIETPGHTPGGVCLYFEQEGDLFTGDTLFAGSVGRTDLPGGNSRTLANSLNRLKLLPGSVRVHPGHGPSTDIATERETNFFLRSPA